MTTTGRRPHTGSLTPQILALNAEGLPNITIARRLGCSRSNVRQALKANNRASIYARPKIRPPTTDPTPIPVLTAAESRIAPDND